MVRFDDAACLDADPSLFFATGRGDHYTEAREICRSCPVVVECREYALDNDVQHGMWGGWSPMERQMGQAIPENRLDPDPDRGCTIDGCERPHNARGWCMLHYGRWQRSGDPLKSNKRGRKRLAPDDDTIVELVKAGHTTSEIADLYDVSRQAISGHRTRLREAGRLNGEVQGKSASLTAQEAS